MFHGDMCRVWASTTSVLLSHVLACSAGDDGSYDDEGPESRSQLLTEGSTTDDLPVNAPRELLLRGRLYVRESSLSEDELQQM